METERRETMTAVDAVNATRNLLGEIAIPVRYKEQIDIIIAAMRNLDIIVHMIEEEKRNVEDVGNTDNNN